MYTSGITECCLCLKGRHVAKNVVQILKTRRIWVTMLSLKDLAAKFLEIGERVTKCMLRKCPEDAKKEHEQGRGFEYLESHASGVWVVHLTVPNVINHVLVVDCNERVILDNAELYPVYLTATNLRSCAGAENSDEARIEGYRPVVGV